MHRVFVPTLVAAKIDNFRFTTSPQALGDLRSGGARSRTADLGIMRRSEPPDETE
jgi:hypothetical protein